MVYASLFDGHGYDVDVDHTTTHPRVLKSR